MNNLLIAKLEWSKVELEDGSQFRDVMLAPGFCKEWCWKLSNTNHSKGIQIQDVETLLEYNIEALILSRGVDLVLHVPAATYAFSLDKVPMIIVDQTTSAVEHYNRLVKMGKRVGALIHSTC